MLQEFLCAAPTPKTAALLSDSNTPKHLRNNILLIKQAAMATLTWVFWVAWRLQNFAEFSLVNSQPTRAQPLWQRMEQQSHGVWELESSYKGVAIDVSMIFQLFWKGVAPPRQKNKYSWDIKFIFHPSALGFHIFVWLLVQTVDDKIPLNTRSFCRIPLL